MAEYRLTYFDMKGRAEPIRILFALADVEYEDIRISTENFAKMKPKLPYGELPIIEIGDKLRLSQSGAIGRLLSKKFGFHGTDDTESAKIDEIADACTDYAAAYWGFWGSSDPAVKERCIKNFVEIASPKYLGKFSQVLEENGGDYLVGKTITWADIVVFNMIDYFDGLTQTTLTDKYPNLQAFVKNISSMPKIQEWIERRPRTTV